MFFVLPQQKKECSTSVTVFLESFVAMIYPNNAPAKQFRFVHFSEWTSSIFWRGDFTPNIIV